LWKPNADLLKVYSSFFFANRFLDIDELFAEGVKPWKSHNFAPHDRLDELVENPKNIDNLRATYEA